MEKHLPPKYQFRPLEKVMKQLQSLRVTPSVSSLPRSDIGTGGIFLGPPRVGFGPLHLQGPDASEKKTKTHTHTLYENKGGVHQTFSVRGGQPTTPACRLHHPLLSCWPTLSVPAGVKEEPLTPVEEAPQCSKHPDAESARPA